MSVESLFAADLETGRALHLAHEAEQYVEQDGIRYDDQARHCREASDALRRAASRLEGESFRLRRASAELDARHKGEGGTAA